MWILFSFGWLLVAIASVLYARGTALFLVILFAVGTVLLLSDKNFPQRRKALMTSWIGPLMIGLVYKFDMAIINTKLREGIFYFDAVWIALFMTWLWRCYGFLTFIPFLAYMPSRRKLSRSDRKQQLLQMSEEYPLRYWWTVPALLAVFFIAHGLILQKLFPWLADRIIK